MSLLGETVDNFIIFFQSIITGIGSITTFLIDVILGIKDFIVSFFIFIPTLLTLLYDIFNLLSMFLSILLNPYLLMFMILGSAFWYAGFTATTKKDLLIKSGVYWKFVGESFVKIANGLYYIVNKIVTSIIDMI
jgi:hypothetical protein